MSTSSSIASVMSDFKEWNTEYSALIFEKEGKVMAVKASKRGNDVYTSRVREKLNDVSMVFDDVGLTSKIATRKKIKNCNRRDNYVTNAIFLTLTVGPDDLREVIKENTLYYARVFREIVKDGKKTGVFRLVEVLLTEREIEGKQRKFNDFKSSREFQVLLETKEWARKGVEFVDMSPEGKPASEIDRKFRQLYIQKGDEFKASDCSYAWLLLSYSFHRFIAAFRKKYGTTFYISVPESHKSGFPHLHLMLITKKEWDVKYYTSNGGKRMIVASRKVADEISSLWEMGFVDFKGIAADRVGSIRGYIFKDLLKSYARKVENKTDHDVQTMALNWLFQKRAYTVSSVKHLDWALNDLDDPSELIYLLRDLNRTGFNGEVFEKYKREGWAFLGVRNVLSYNGWIPPPFFVVSSVFFRSRDLCNKNQ